MRNRRQRGFTLIEVVVSIAIMSILMTAVGSLMVFSARSLPNPDDPATMAISSGVAINRFADDVRESAAVVEAGSWAFEVQVADRDGDTSPDTIRYEWSGTPGDPLVRTYNGDRYEVLIDEVQSLVLEYETEASDFSPHVLLVVPDSSSMTTEDAQRRTLLESWGCAVTTISESETQATFDAAFLGVSVVYVSEDVLSDSIASKLTDCTRGVVVEEGQLYDELGISTTGYVINDGEIDITDNSHAVTSGLSLGVTRITNDYGGLMITGGSVTAGLQVLAEQPFSVNPTLAVMEAGAAQAGIGGTTAGRRVKLPWGNTSEFDLNDLTADALTIMQQSVAWASEHDVIKSVRLTISGVSGSSATVQRQVQLVNFPMEPSP